MGIHLQNNELASAICCLLQPNRLPVGALTGQPAYAGSSRGLSCWIAKALSWRSRLQAYKSPMALQEHDGLLLSAYPLKITALRKFCSAQVCMVALSWILASLYMTIAVCTR